MSSELMKTRADLKRELMETVPPGEELSVLAQAEASLSASREELHELRTQRAALMRQISVRERKLQDWKGKIPRTQPPSMAAAEKELARLGDMPCHRVAGLDGAKLVFEKEFARALTGLDGFEKIWLFMHVPSGFSFERGHCLGDIYLCLVDVLEVDVKQGIVEISELPVVGDTRLLDDVAILDIKPYLAYCEAWPASDGVDSFGKELHGHTVHAVAQSRGAGPVLEDVAKVTAAVSAADFSALEQDVADRLTLNDTVGERASEGRPPGT